MTVLSPVPSAGTLRERFIADMTVREYTAKTQHDYRRDSAERYRTMTLPLDEFICRFLLHVLPRGFHRIRHYGLLASGGRRDNLARVRELLAVAPPPPAPEPNQTPPEPDDHRPPCPCCGGRMLILETFERCAQPRAPPRPARSPGRCSS